MQYPKSFMAAEQINPISNGVNGPLEADNPAQTWRPLRLLNLYRLVISGVFVVFAFSDMGLKPIGDTYPTLFAVTATLYLLLSIGNAFTITWRQPAFITQVYIQIMVDIVAITLIMHASGGVKSGLGMMLIIAIAGGSILLAGQAALRLAAAAALFMLGEHIYSQLTQPLQSTAYTQAGLLGISFFATAFLAHALAKRVRESEALAARRGVDLASTEQLASYVIQQMQTGVVVIDTTANIWQINESARQLLNIAPLTGKQPLSEICPPLAEQYQRWKTKPDFEPESFRAMDATAETRPHFARLGENSGTLIFLEDTAALKHQAQQLKLASLGRLAGSIAHEIRNPLGAISHAGQLLAESPQLDSNDLRLTEIIRSNSIRMNNIIENVLQLGRRRQPKPEVIKLKPWLEGFVEEFSRSQAIPPGMIQLHHADADISVEFDASQLHQILWNLCHNGVRYSREHCGEPRLILETERDPHTTIPSLSVIDFGAGVAEGAVENIFEPFFTTDNQGTGLGLYISKELCECNQARLTYSIADTTNGGCFRLTFADPRRRRTV